MRADYSKEELVTSRDGTEMDHERRIFLAGRPTAFPVSDGEVLERFPQHRRLLCKPYTLPDAVPDHSQVAMPAPFVRKPAFNPDGLGVAEVFREAKAEDDVKPGHVLQPLYEGEHLSVDLVLGEGRVVDAVAMRAVYLGDPAHTRPAWWETPGRTETFIDPDACLRHLSSPVRTGYRGVLNIETIGGHLIDVHPRASAQFLPIWGDAWIDALDCFYRGGMWSHPTPRTGRSYACWGDRVVTVAEDGSSGRAAVVNVVDGAPAKPLTDGVVPTPSPGARVEDDGFVTVGAGAWPASEAGYCGCGRELVDGRPSACSALGCLYKARQGDEMTTDTLPPLSQRAVRIALDAFILALPWPVIDHRAERTALIAALVAYEKQVRPTAAVAPAARLASDYDVEGIRRIARGALADNAEMGVKPIINAAKAAPHLAQWVLKLTDAERSAMFVVGRDGKPGSIDMVPVAFIRDLAKLCREHALDPAGLSTQAPGDLPEACGWKPILTQTGKAFPVFANHLQQKDDAA